MLKCIFSCTIDGVIGVNNTIPWNISEDLKFFKQQTEGNIVIMGRNTFESIGKPLPNRTNIVITSHSEKFKDYENVITAKDLHEALQIANESKDKSKNESKDIFVIGGAKLLNETFPIADEIIVSLVDDKYMLKDMTNKSISKISLSFMEFLSLKKVIPFNDFNVYVFNNSLYK